MTRQNRNNMTIEDLLDAWRVNNVVTLELLDGCTDDDFELKPGKGKTIRSNFVHIIGVRKMWLDDKVRQQVESALKLDWKTATRDEICSGLELTADLMAQLFAKKEGSTKTSKLSTIKFFAYCIAHEANHRAQIEISLRINGREPDDAFLYDLWEWGKK